MGALLVYDVMDRNERKGNENAKLVMWIVIIFVFIAVVIFIIYYRKCKLSIQMQQMNQMNQMEHELTPLLDNSLPMTIKNDM